MFPSAVHIQFWPAIAGHILGDLEVCIWRKGIWKCIFQGSRSPKYFVDLKKYSAVISGACVWGQGRLRCIFQVPRVFCPTWSSSFYSLSFSSFHFHFSGFHFWCSLFQVLKVFCLLSIKMCKKVKHVPLLASVAAAHSANHFYHPITWHSQRIHLSKISYLTLLSNTSTIP